MEDNNMFDMFKEEFSDIEKNNLITNETDLSLIANLQKERENKLSNFAAKSSLSQGRLKKEKPCVVRSPYERDIGRIIYSEAFRRLRHKTQVFFNPNNDHFCSRIEHVNYVSYIASIIGRALNLNIDLIRAIALGHDVGHAPFGHSGERQLAKCLNTTDKNLSFSHEVQSLKVLDCFEHHGEHVGLNLTFEVRDGIVSHCGESYGEQYLKPKRDKEKEKLYEYSKDRTIAPATLEGCVVRFADKIAYVGRDLEDAIRAGLSVGFDDFPDSITNVLGNSNSDIIDNLVSDIIHTTIKTGEDLVALSDRGFKAFNELLIYSKENLYYNDKIKVYEKKTNLIVEELYNYLLDITLEIINDFEKYVNSSNVMVSQYAQYIFKHYDLYVKLNEKPAIIVADYIAGMTDNYATICFERIFGV